MGRSKIIKFFRLFILIFCCWGLGFTQEQTQQGNNTVTQRIEFKGDPFEQRISLDLRNIDVIEALKYLSTKTGMNIVSSKLVTGRVTLTVENCLVKDIFDIILRSNSLAYEKRGDIYYIMTEQEYKALYGKNFSDVRQVRMLRLKYAIPSQAFSLLDMLKSEVGRVLVDPESGNILIIDAPENIEKMEKALEDFERKDTVEVFSLRYAKAKELEEILKTKLDDKKVGSIKADERNNQVIVQALPERMSEIRRLIALLDRQTKEVLIDTKIIKVNFSDKVDSGIEWEGLFDVARKYGLTYLGSYPFSYIGSGSNAPWVPRYTWYKGGNISTGNGTMSYTGINQIGSYPFSGTTSNYISGEATKPLNTKKVMGELMHLGIIDEKRDFDVLLNYLKTIGNVQILSNPKLVVTNNQEARLHIGERYAYVTSTAVTTQNAPSTVAEEVNFIDVGIQLAVTPNINDDGFITIKVKPEISSVKEWLETAQKNKIPIVDTTVTETTVLVKDGVSVLIGGLRRQDKIRDSQQMPILGKVPLLGYFFRNQTERINRAEYLVILTPHIISGDVLVTGDEREDRGFRDYSSLVPEEKEILQNIKPKPYRDYKGDNFILE